MRVEKEQESKRRSEEKMCKWDPDRGGTTRRRTKKRRSKKRTKKNEGLRMRDIK